MKKLKILITGVAGFLGSHLAEKLSELNSELDSTTAVVDSSLTLNTIY